MILIEIKEAIDEIKEKFNGSRRQASAAVSHVKTRIRKRSELKPDPKFTIFKWLPLEIRLKIAKGMWELLPPKGRTVEIRFSRHLNDFIAVADQVSLLDICQETRRVGMELGYRFMFKTGCVNGRGTWFFPELDTLYLSPFHDNKNYLFQHFNWEDMRLIQRIALAHTQLSDMVWEIRALPPAQFSTGRPHVKVEFLNFKEIIVYKLGAKELGRIDSFIPRLPSLGLGYDNNHGGCIRNRVCIETLGPVHRRSRKGIYQQVWKYKKERVKWETMSSITLPLPEFQEGMVCRKGLRWKNDGTYM